MDDETRAILDVARSVLEDLDSETVLTRVLESARALTGARYAALGVLDESRTSLARFLTRGMDEDARSAIGSLPAGRGVLGELIRDPTPLRLADVGAHPRSYGFPLGHPPMRSFLGVSIVVAGEPFGNLYLTDKEGADEFSADDEEAVVLLAQFAGLAIDHARRYTDAESQRSDLQRTVDALDATLQITRALAGQTDLAAILELVAKRGRALVSARTLVIELADEGDLVIAAGAGELPVDLIGKRVALADTVASAAMRTRQTQRLDELNLTRFEQHGLGQLGLSAQDGLVVPLVFRNEVYGMLVAVDQLEGERFTDQHQQLLEAFAASAGMAVATAESAATERRRQSLAATEAERARWARELHDETLQGLAGLRLVLAAAERAGTSEAMADAIGRAVGQLEFDIASLRSLITDLRPAALDELGTEAAIRALGDRLTLNGLDVEVTADLAFEAGRVNVRHVPELETAIYRIIQESLTNAVKHGRARRAEIEIVEDDAMVHLTIRDDGQGFDTSSHSAGFGLRGMRERAELLKGTISVDSAPGRPTVVTARLPVRLRSAAAAQAPQPQPQPLRAGRATG